MLHQSAIRFARFRSVIYLFVLFIALSGVSACSGGGGGDGGGGGGSSGGKETHETTLLTSDVIPAGYYKTITLSGQSLARNALTQGSGNVNEIVFDSDVPLFIHKISSGGTTFYDYDGSTGTISWSRGFPITPYYFYYWLLSDSYSGGAVLPCIHTAASSFPSGDYEFKVGNPYGTDANVSFYQVSKNDSDFSKGDLDINLIIYTLGEPNEVIPNEAEAENIKTYMNQIFNQVGVTVGTVNVEFRNDPSVIAQIPGEDAIDPFLRVASKGTAGRSDVGVNCFLIPQLPSNILGVDGSIPGPGFLHGVSSSGIIAQIAPYGYAAQGYTEHETDQFILAKILAHEIGHYLGLFHTTENDGTANDAVTDTPRCGPENDTNNDGKVTGPECRGKGADYLMFWVTDFQLISGGDFQIKLSSQEGQVINTHPSIL